jgi:hypothetical protein
MVISNQGFIHNVRSDSWGSPMYMSAASFCITRYASSGGLADEVNLLTTAEVMLNGILANTLYDLPGRWLWRKSPSWMQTLRCWENLWMSRSTKRGSFSTATTRRQRRASCPVMIPFSENYTNLHEVD